MEEDRSVEWKHGKSIDLEKEMSTGLILRSPDRVSIREEGRGRSLHAEGPKTEKVQESTVESLVRGICRLRVSESYECQLAPALALCYSTMPV